MKNNLLQEIITMSKPIFYVIFLQVMFASFLFAEESSAQKKSLYDIEISVKQKDASVIEIFNEIESKTDFLFTYNDNFIETDKISVNKRNKSIGQILEYLSEKTNLQFKRINDNIHVNLKDGDDPSVYEDYDDAEITVSGTIIDSEGEVLPGVTVLVKGTTTGTVSGVDGSYSISVDEEGTLVFSSVGFISQEVSVNGRAVIDVTMEYDVQALSEVVVTGYTSQRKADIIGSVAVVDTDDLLTNPSPNITSQLQGRAAGVVVSGDGQPGGAAKIRIRGFTSFGQSDPLYVIDGVQTKDASKINPMDIESVQILKDAASASIYGARAAQGVIIITTKGGQVGRLRVSYSGYTGASYIPTNLMPEMLNTEEYLEYLRRNNGEDYVHPVFGRVGDNNIPDYIVTSSDVKSGFNAGAPEVDPGLYSLEEYGDVYQIMETSAGTNWFEEATQAGILQNHQLTASGGNDQTSYSVSLNLFDQKGTFKYTGYKRYAARVNTAFTPEKYLKFGENLQFIYENRQGNNPNARGEGGPWAQAYRMVPYIPVRDINGGWGGNSVGESGNGTNPVALLNRNKDNENYNYKIFGNIFAEVTPVEGLTLRSSYGIDYGNFYNKSFTYQTYERSENVSITNLGNSYNYNLTWTWTNTATFSKTFGNHQVKLLGGTEAIKFHGDGITVSTNTFDFEDPNFISLNTDLSTPTDVSAVEPTPWTIYSLFGRLEYIFQDKYLLNATIRRDGTSKIHKDYRYGVFPALSVGWRLSEEPFLNTIAAIDDLKLRFGWGQSGNVDVVNSANQFTFYSSGVGFSNYDIGRTQNNLATGYTPYRSGSITTQWEVSESTNFGIDGSLFDGQIEFAANYFINNTNDLLVPRIKNGVEPQTLQPSINLGKMQNKGFELNLTSRNRIGDLEYDATLTFTHYKNEVVDIDGNPESFFSRGTTRLSEVTRTEPGKPISYFYGYEIDGFFETSADTAAIEQEGEVIGAWRFKDQDGDGDIDSDDRVMIGSPHPDFVAGLNVDLRYKGFDFNVFFVWNQGNELFNYTKYFTDMRIFVGGVSRRVLENGWTPEDPSGELPYLAPGAESGYTSFIRSVPSSYYIEDGSYLRAKTIQIGYSLPRNILNTIGMESARIYLQGQNLFTITGYSGPDPDINLIGSQNDDRFIGVDNSGFPNPRQVLVGLNLSF